MRSPLRTGIRQWLMRDAAGAQMPAATRSSAATSGSFRDR